MHYEASAAIQAPPEHIWAILTDAEGIPRWDSGIDRIEGRIEPGERIKLVSKVNPGRSFPLRVSEWIEARKMVWTGGMPLGLFRGVRTFTLTPARDHTTFTMREEFSGPLLPLIARSMPDLGPSFRAVRARAGGRRRGDSHQRKEDIVTGRFIDGVGTAADPWKLNTPSGGSEFLVHRDEQSNPPSLVVRVGKTELRYDLRCIDDLHAMLKQQGDWVPLGNADEGKPVVDGSVEAWARSEQNPVGGYYGLRKGYRGRFGNYVPPVLEALGLAEVEHNPRNNRMRAL